MALNALEDSLLPQSEKIGNERVKIALSQNRHLYYEDDKKDIDDKDVNNDDDSQWRWRVSRSGRYVRTGLARPEGLQPEAQNSEAGVQFLGTGRITNTLAVFTQRRSVAKNVGCFRWDLFVCGFVFGSVCQHDNLRTSKHRMMKLRGRCIVRISAEFEFGGS